MKNEKNIFVIKLRLHFSSVLSPKKEERKKGMVPTR